MSTNHHRGAHPDDARLFSRAAVAELRLACEEARYLLSRGYATSSVVDVVGRRHALEARQRLALQRSVCSEQQQKARAAKQVELARAQGHAIGIDGFNLIIGLEVALSGGVLLRGQDGALRDLAGLRGSYHTVAETGPALNLVSRLLNGAAPSLVRFWLDAPVSNSGRLRALIREAATLFAMPVEVELVPNPDAELAGKSYVVSGDALVLDRCESYLNLLELLSSQLEQVWIVELG